MRKTHRILGLLALVALAPLAAAVGAYPTGIYSVIPGHVTAQVPGLPDGTYFESFDRPYRSPDGTMWIMSAIADTDTAVDEFILVGSGINGPGAQLVVREGDQAPWAPVGYTIGPIDGNMGITNSGMYAFATNLGGSAPSGEDEQIVRWNGLTFNVAAQEGQPVPGVVGEVWGTTLDSALITNDGTVGFRGAATVGGLPTDQDDFVMYGSTIVAQSGVTVPGGSADPWQIFDLERYYRSADGAHYIVQGDTTGDSGMDDIVAVDNMIVVQEGTALGAFPSPVSAITESFMMSSADWFARGSNADGQDWVVRNGAVLVSTGDPVPGGLEGETFSDAPYASCFFLMTGNNNGDYVYAGTTSNPDELADAVLIYNDEYVLARQGDPVDLDGNGLFDDNAYINVFNNDDAFLTDDGWYFFTATLFDDIGTDLGQAFMAILIPEPGTLSLLALLILRRRR